MHNSGNSALIERVAPQPTERAPISMAPIERVRSTSATQRRIENMQKLIGELSTHEMLADEIAWFLKFSPSGARKYIRDLREAGVIELARYIEGTATYLGKAVYQISPDPDRVKAFLAAIVQPKREGAAPRKERPGLREQAWPAPAATSTSWPTTPTMLSASTAARWRAIRWSPPCSAPRLRPTRTTLKHRRGRPRPAPLSCTDRTIAYPERRRVRRFCCVLPIEKRQPSPRSAQAVGCAFQLMVLTKGAARWKR